MKTARLCIATLVLALLIGACGDNDVSSELTLSGEIHDESSSLRDFDPLRVRIACQEEQWEDDCHIHEGEQDTVRRILQRWADANIAGGTCEGYSDFRAGNNVVIKDGSGNVIGAGNLDVGNLEVTPIIGVTSFRLTCKLPFSIPLTREAEFYSIEVNGVEGPVFPHADLASRDWFVILD